MSEYEKLVTKLNYRLTYYHLLFIVTPINYFGSNIDDNIIFRIIQHSRKGYET